VSRKLVLIVIDGLTPSAFERAVESKSAPTLAQLAAEGEYAHAVSVFPSLTPVCLTSIATGAGPDIHRIPHLVWYHRGEGRVVEYGSSFGALRAAGVARSIVDAIFEMNQQHLSRDAVTVYESLEDAGLIAAAVNITCYRGRTEHRPTLPGVTKRAFGPRRFFFYSLFESDRTGAPLAVRNRAGGSLDAYAARVGRWLVTRDGFDFLAYYLSDYDFASHVHGPAVAERALGRVDAAVASLVEAAGGLDEFLSRYAVVLCSDHGQTDIEHAVRLEHVLGRRTDIFVAASNRAAMLYRLGDGSPEPAELAAALDGEPSVDVVLWREGDEAVARRRAAEMRFAPDGAAWATSGEGRVLDYPDAFARAWSALGNPNAGDVLVSAAPGYEFADLAGRHHAGGGSHGSLTAGDSLVPMLGIGIEALPTRITEIAPAVLAYFGIEPPAYAGGLAHAA
jgi:predicted AlkP superfamily pyrophosphatase or phosphodiesterase